jgi:hypothetical protein
MFSTAQPHIQTKTQQMKVRTLNIQTTGIVHMQPTNRDRSEKHGDLPTSAVQMIHVHKFVDNLEAFTLKSMS